MRFALFNATVPLFAAIFSEPRYALDFSTTLCALKRNGHNVALAIQRYPSSFLSSSDCLLDVSSFETVSSLDVHLPWLSHSTVYLFSLGSLDAPLPKRNGLTHIVLAEDDLLRSSWFANLSLTEWSYWKTPRIDVSVITKDRPRSLLRLLSSLSRSFLFGDTLNLRVYLDQPTDCDTLQLVQSFDWRHGSITIHRRILHAGLLAAVIESWYPSNNDTYGLILEDDTELSPMWYIWVKRAILRYRYEYPFSQLYGVSLYQQKFLELRPEGRRFFDPRLFFSMAGVDPHTIPYLSQIPCSWGAVYFPEHWIAFHTYISLRLSESIVPIDELLVPNGLVMLYPNFEDFISLSTNHLELGSHVTINSRQKQDLFTLPLMNSSSAAMELLHLDFPHWADIPVMNLTGYQVSLSHVQAVAAQYRDQIHV